MDGWHGMAWHGMDGWKTKNPEYAHLQMKNCVSGVGCILWVMVLTRKGGSPLSDACTVSHALIIRSPPSSFTSAAGST